MKPRVPPPRPEYLKFLAAYESRITTLALAARRLVLEQAPDAIELIYDVYNAVAANYSFTGRPSDGFMHIAAYAQWVNLGFNRGSELDDPQGVLQGSGRWIRHIKIAEPRDLKAPAIRAFVRAAVAHAKRPDPRGSTNAMKGRSVVRAIYAKKRRPSQRRNGGI
jgi:hypothetical protein